MKQTDATITRSLVIHVDKTIKLMLNKLLFNMSNSKGTQFRYICNLPSIFNTPEFITYIDISKETYIFNL